MLRHDARGQLRRGPLPGVGLREAGCLSLDLLQKRAADAMDGMRFIAIEHTQSYGREVAQFDGAFARTKLKLPRYNGRYGRQLMAAALRA